MAKTTDLVLSAEDRKELEEILNSDASDDMKQRANILLYKAEGKSLWTVAAELGAAYTVVCRWVKRYEQRAPGTSLKEVLTDRRSQGKRKKRASKADADGSGTAQADTP